MTHKDKQDVIAICNILADKMSDSGKVAVQQIIGAVKDMVENEPCEDCISREETLKYSHIEYDDDGEGHRVIYAEDIEELSSVTPQPKWIPVSERLPEKIGRYLTYIINKYDKKFQYIMICGYNNKYWFPDDDCASDNVVAWIPLPEPYKEDNNAERDA